MTEGLGRPPASFPRFGCHFVTETQSLWKLPRRLRALAAGSAIRPLCARVACAPRECSWTRLRFSCWVLVPPLSCCGQSPRLLVSSVPPLRGVASRLPLKQSAAASTSPSRTFWPPRFRWEASTPRVLGRGPALGLSARDAPCPRRLSRDLHPPATVPTSHLRPAPSPKGPGIPTGQDLSGDECRSV